MHWDEHYCKHLGPHTHSGSLKPWLLVRVWEIQKRSLLHAHPVLAYLTPREKASADRYLEILDALRHQYGFGYVEGKHSKDLTQASGVTMRSLRLRRYAWVLWRHTDPTIWAMTGWNRKTSGMAYGKGWR
jgi:hypothetical protein